MSDTEKKFYVYVHKYASGPNKGKVFYVGKGCGRRAWHKSKRSKEWKVEYRSFGRVVNIIFQTDSDVCAYSFEKIVIGFYGIENLVNKCKGGEGVSWGGSRTEYLGSGNPRYDATVYQFRHKDFGVFSGTKSELSNTFSLSIFGVYSVVSGKRTHVGGWHLNGRKPNMQKGEDHPSFDPTEYEFIHKEHGQLKTTRYHLCKEYGLSRSNLNEMIKGKYSTTKGWRILK